MSTLSSNPKMAQFKRGLSVVGARAMSAVVKNFRNKVIGTILAAVLAPQACFAGGHGHGGMSHGGGHSSSGSSMKSVQRSSNPTRSFQGTGSKQTLHKSQSNVVKRQAGSNSTSNKAVAAKNGNTGAGLPNSHGNGSLGKTKNNGTVATNQHGSSFRDLMKVNPVNKVTGNGGSAFPKGRLSKSELLAKYGVKNNGSLGKGNKNPSSPSNPSQPSNPSKGQHSKNFDRWCRNGFPWLWGFYSPVAPYPSYPVVISQPTPVYVDTPVAAAESQPTPAPPTVAQPTDATPADATVSNTVVPDTALTDAIVSDAPRSDTPVSGAAAGGSVDLVVEHVQFVEPATSTAGPAYRVKFRNDGTQAAGPFRIGAFAERDDKLSDDAPQIVTEVASLAAGDASEVTLRLPVSAMRLVSTSAAQGVAFDQLLVIIDLDDSIVETEKSNNVVNLERTELEVAAR